MKELNRIFNYGRIKIRTIIEDNEPLFIAQDICKAVDIEFSQTRRLFDDEKVLRLTHTPGGSQKMLYVNEFGLYNLILGSRKPEAQNFKRWVTHEVLPSIRKTGSYGGGLQKAEEALTKNEIISSLKRKVQALKEVLDVYESLESSNHVFSQSLCETISMMAVHLSVDAAKLKMKLAK